jgi:hypothetical protein
MDHARGGEEDSEKKGQRLHGFSPFLLFAPNNARGAPDVPPWLRPIAAGAHTYVPWDITPSKHPSARGAINSARWPLTESRAQRRR